jgi:putative transposase
MWVSTTHKRRHPMTELTIALREYLRKMGVELEGDFLREGIALLVRLLMEMEVGEQIGADRYERTDERQTHRNGYRDRSWETRAGEIPLQVPKLRQGRHFPSFLEPRRRAERALVAVIQAAYVEGVSRRKVDDLVQALGLTGIDKSKVSRVCKELNEAVSAFRSRPLEAEYPYLWLDALYVKVRQNHRIVSMAVVIAIGVRETGEREILDVEVGGSEDQAFWTSFLRGLVARGQKGLQVAISDAHQGLWEAVERVLAGASWQRCGVHFMRNVLAHVPKRDKAIVAAARAPSSPSRTRRRQAAVGGGGGSDKAALAQGGPGSGGGRGRRAHLYGVPAVPLDPHLVHQPVGAPEQGSQEAHERGLHLP